MANTLTGLYQTIYTSLDKVSRELVGMIPSVNRDASAEMAAKGQTVSYPVTPESTSTTISPAMTIPEGTAQTIAADTMTISNFKAVQIPWDGEEEKAMGNAGIYNTIMGNQMEQAFRTLTNAIEQDLVDAGVLGASRAYGTAGTAPFQTVDNLGDIAGLEEILDDNGAPAMKSLVLTTRGYVPLRTKMANLFKVNEAGESRFLRSDVMGQIYNFDLGKTGAKYSHTKGTQTGADLTAVEPIGETSLAFDGSDAGTFVAGDIVTIGGGSDKYVVVSGTAAATGTLIINSPGLVLAGAIADEIVTGDSYSLAGLGFSPDAMLLATRIPAVPGGGDAADDEMIVTDPVSGLSFRVALYKGYHKKMIDVSIAWGVKAVKPAHIAMLLG